LPDGTRAAANPRVAHPGPTCRYTPRKPCRYLLVGPPAMARQRKRRARLSSEPAQICDECWATFWRVMFNPEAIAHDIDIGLHQVKNE
jgi:hypothetical protein